VTFEIKIMRRLILAAVLALSTFVCGTPARACPMCQVANESGEPGEDCAVRDARPRAYMYSILFMLAMPATLLTGFGFGFYRLHRQVAEGELPDTDVV
jgi:hypothetical protein